MSHGEIKQINGKRVASPEYRSWQALRNRCLNPLSKNYATYGGRGITITPRWDKFEAFLQDMGRRPGPEYTLDRKNNDGPYNKRNCRWATRKTQARNRPYAATQAWVLAERLGLKPMTVHHMIWQVRTKDKGNTKWFALSPEMESIVRKFLQENKKCV